MSISHKIFSSIGMLCTLLDGAYRKRQIQTRIGAVEMIHVTNRQIFKRSKTRLLPLNIQTRLKRAVRGEYLYVTHQSEARYLIQKHDLRS